MVTVTYHQHDARTDTPCVVCGEEEERRRMAEVS